MSDLHIDKCHILTFGKQNFKNLRFNSFMPNFIYNYKKKEV